MDYIDPIIPMTVPDAHDTPASPPVPAYHTPAYSPMTAIPVIPLDCANQMTSMAAENVRLTEKLHQKKLKERAYQEILEHFDNYTYTFTTTGRPVLLMSCVVEQALHCIPAPLCRMKPFYLISLKGHRNPIYLEETVFLKSSALLTALSEHPGVTIHLQRSEKQTASLIRLAISAHIQVLHVDFYAGWRLVDQNNVLYSKFPDGKTHLVRDSLDLNHTAQNNMTKAERTLAVQCYTPVFSAISDPMLRAFSVLWFHCCQIASLLHAIGHPLPLSLYLFAPSGEVNQYYRRLFQWDDDLPTSISATPSVFAEELLMRKDQPLLILDEGHGTHAKANTIFLESSLTNGHISWKNGSVNHILPIQALPTILSARYTSLSCVPSMLTLDLPDNLIDIALYESFSVQISDNSDYRAAFIAYTAEYFPHLKGYVAARKKTVFNRLSDSLDNNAATMFAVLLGVADLLNDFFASCFPAVPPVQFDKNFSDWLCQQLQYQSESRSSYAGLVDHFTHVTRTLIRRGELSLRHVKEGYVITDAPTIYADERCFHFTSKALHYVCRHLCESRPVILRELGQAGIILGTPINTGTTMTRISLWDDQSNRHCIAVYKMDRSFFEQFGDPFIFNGKEPPYEPHV